MLKRYFVRIIKIDQYLVKIWRYTEQQNWTW